MSPVSLRCPACGTTQSHTGECDACSEDQVRYFCGNHDPGLWLRGPTCHKCGAELGKTPKRPPLPSRPAPAPPRETRAPEPRRSTVRRRERPLEPTREPEIEVQPSLAEILTSVLGARWRRPSSTDGEMEWESAPELRMPTLPLRGCLIRLMWLIVLLVAFGFIAVFILVTGMLQVGRF